MYIGLFTLDPKMRTGNEKHSLPFTVKYSQICTLPKCEPEKGVPLTVM